MLPYKISTISPHINNMSRLYLLSSGAEFGSTELHDEHIMDRLDHFVRNLDNNQVPNIYDKMKTREYPDLDRGKVLGNSQVVTDILLKDNFRQHSGIEEKYRKKLSPLHSLRNIFDPATKYHRSISRGFERQLIEMINRLDTEKLDRQTLNPILV
jgi:hypothetical protein